MSVAGGSSVVFDDEELQRIYTWVDEVPLSRPKRNITRDFSDGGALFSVLTSGSLGGDFRACIEAAADSACKLLMSFIFL
jgi:hypothetical protein